MDGSAYLNDQFLIAMPSLADPNFYRTVTYMCAHNEEGAMGIVINRPLQLNLDGEPYRDTRFQFEVIPQALGFILGPTAPTRSGIRQNS